MPFTIATSYWFSTGRLVLTPKSGDRPAFPLNIVHNVSLDLFRRTLTVRDNEFAESLFLDMVGGVVTDDPQPGVVVFGEKPPIAHFSVLFEGQTYKGEPILFEMPDAVLTAAPMVFSHEDWAGVEFSFDLLPGPCGYVCRMIPEGVTPPEPPPLPALKIRI